MLGTAERLVSTVLQGVYQSNQATAAACQVNNLHLLRGMIGRPGAGVLQMNGQPTAQNTRETGADGDLPGMRNWDNPDHIRELAELWNVDPMTIPHWAPPTHAMQIWRYAEQGSIELLWISATNPAVSLPELARIRRILEREELFVVVQDVFLTETAELADVVLPAANWGEKTGTFTNADRTVHLSEKAVEPPGEARADLEIFLDYAARMDFRDRDGEPLIKWHDPEGAFEAWKECSRGRPCDYSALTYDALRGGGSWPCQRPADRAAVRRRAGSTPTRTTRRPTAQDLRHGRGFDEQSTAPSADGRAFLQRAPYQPAARDPRASEYPLLLTTGRTIYHFHTRTKTGRTPELDGAAPEAWVELSPGDADALGIAEGDLVRSSPPRGRDRGARPRHGIRPASCSSPSTTGSGASRARGAGARANELTLTRLGPRVQAADLQGRRRRASGAAGRADAARPLHRPPAPRRDRARAGLPRGGRGPCGRGRRPHHVRRLRGGATRHEEALKPFIDRYGERAEDEPQRLHSELFRGTREGRLALLRDLQDLYLMASECDIAWTLVGQAAQGARDDELFEVVQRCEGETSIQSNGCARG